MLNMFTVAQLMSKVSNPLIEKNTMVNGRLMYRRKDYPMKVRRFSIQQEPYNIRICAKPMEPTDYVDSDIRVADLFDHMTELSQAHLTMQHSIPEYDQATVLRELDCRSGVWKFFT